MTPTPRLVCASVNTEVCLPLPVTACQEAVTPVSIFQLIFFLILFFLHIILQVCVAVTRTSCAPSPAQACAEIEVDVCKEVPEVRLQSE